MARSVDSTPLRISIGLSREELYVLMRLLKMKQVPGFDLAWLRIAQDGTIPSEVQQAIEAAIRALIARGYLVRAQEDQVTGKIPLYMPAPVIALLGACGFAEYNILLAFHTSNAHLQMYLHEYQKLVVVHTMPIPEVHQFEALQNRETMFKLINTSLALQSQEARSVPSGKAYAVYVQAARDAAIIKKEDEAVFLLKLGGLPDITAEALGMALCQATAMGTVALSRREADGTWNKTTVALVISPTSGFLLSETGSHPSAFQVQPIDADGVRNWVTSHLC